MLILYTTVDRSKVEEFKEFVDSKFSTEFVSRLRKHQLLIRRGSSETYLSRT